MRKLCPHCSAQLSRPDAAFCATCGRSLQPSGGQKTQRVSSPDPQLLIQEPNQADRSVTLNQPRLTLGRDPAQNDVVVASRLVSRQHAMLERMGGSYVITDLGSTNGTRVNGQLLPSHQSHPLQDRDIVRIGDQQGNSVGLVYHSSTTSTAHAGTISLGKLNLTHLARFTIGRDPANEIHLDHPTVSRQHARVEQTAQGHQILDLNSSNGTFVNGQPVRGSHPLQTGDVVQVGPFKLVYDQAGFTQYTAGGNYHLDGISLKREVSLVGPLSPRRLFGLNGRPTRKVILKDISLSIKPKEFVALVGGSGAGKSTLLNALSGFVPAEGQVLINGDDLYKNFAAHRSSLGYVPQDDIIHGQLTVRSALTYAAKLRLPPDTDPQEVQQHIADALDQVEMVEHADKQVNQLSGGQRKRVSIAVELLAKPGLFFLDEPTSGLDPGLEKKMMYTLRQLADAGQTIVLVTHATANISQCNHVAFMADSRLVYFGPPQEARTFFNASDFADIYSRLSQPIDPSKNRLPTPCQTYYQQAQAADPNNPPSTAEVWANCFQASPQYQQYVAGRIQTVSPTHQPAGGARQPVRQQASPFQQFAVLAQRYFELIRRDATSLIVLLAVMPFIGVLLLAMAKPHDLVGKESHTIQTEIQETIAEKQADQDPNVPDEQFQASYTVAGSAQKLLFMLALAANLLGIFAAAYEIVKEEAIYRRERMVNLKIGPYLLSKVAVLALFALLQCSLLLLVVRLKVTYPADGVFLPPAIEMFVTLFLATLASVALGLLISATVGNADTVIYVVLLVLFIQILFAGAIFELPSVAKPISYLTTTRWTLEALGSTVDMDALKEQGVSCVEFEDEQTQTMMGEAQAPCEEGQMKQAVDYEFNVSYRYAAGHLLSRWAVLMGFALAFGGLTYVAQKRKDVI